MNLQYVSADDDALWILLELEVRMRQLVAYGQVTLATVRPGVVIVV